MGVRSVAVAEDRRLMVVDRPRPEPGPGEVAVDVAFCGICGSDLHFRDVPALFPAGTVPGHELSGRVGAVGAGVTDWSAGDRVTVLPFAQCGECELCRSGNEQVCPHAIANGVGLGTGRPGGYAERVVVDAAMLFALPAVLDERAAALAEPTAVAVHAVAKAQLTAGHRVVVLGAGPIGVITALVLRARGFEDVMLVSRNAARASAAQGLGLATIALDDAHAAAGAAAVFECAGTSAAANLALELVGPLGRVILVGIAPDGLTIPATAIVFKEAEIRGALVYRRTEFAEAIAMLADGRVPADALISVVVGLDRAEEMFQALTAPGNDRIKVLLAP